MAANRMRGIAICCALFALRPPAYISTASGQQGSYRIHISSIPHMRLAIHAAIVPGRPIAASQGCPATIVKAAFEAAESATRPDETPVLSYKCEIGSHWSQRTMFCYALRGLKGRRIYVASASSRCRNCHCRAKKDDENLQIGKAKKL